MLDVPTNRIFSLELREAEVVGKWLMGVKLADLAEEYPKEVEEIGLNLVVPSSEWITFLEELWDDEPWLPGTIRTQVALIEAPKGPSYLHFH